MRKITALTVTIPLMKKYTKIENAVPVRSGSTTRANVRTVPAPRLIAASSIAGSICLSALIPARTATGNFQNTTLVTRIQIVPVRRSGGTLNARMLPQTKTAPGSPTSQKANRSRAPPPARPAGLPPHPGGVDQVGDEARHDQHDGHRGTRGEVRHPDHLRVDLRREHVVPAADQDRVAEVGHAQDEDD